MPYNEEIGDQILERLADGESLRKICNPDEGFPSRPTFFKWIATNPVFANQYATSREAQADALFDQILDIADETKEDYVKRLGYNGAEPTWEVNGEAIQRSRLRADVRKWMAGKLRPKKYGEKIEVDQTVGVTDALGALLDRVSGQGKRLVPGLELPAPEDEPE